MKDCTTARENPTNSELGQWTDVIVSSGRFAHGEGAPYSLCLEERVIIKTDPDIRAKRNVRGWSVCTQSLRTDSHNSESHVPLKSLPNILHCVQSKARSTYSRTVSVPSVNQDFLTNLVRVNKETLKRDLAEGGRRFAPDKQLESGSKDCRRLEEGDWGGHGP
jgi:hypothetical protein